MRMLPPPGLGCKLLNCDVMDVVVFKEKTQALVCDCIASDSLKILSRENISVE